MKTRGVGRRGGDIVGKYEPKLESPEEWCMCVYAGSRGWFKLHVTKCNVHERKKVITLEKQIFKMIS